MLCVSAMEKIVVCIVCLGPCLCGYGHVTLHVREMGPTGEGAWVENEDNRQRYVCLRREIGTFVSVKFQGQSLEGCFDG